MRVGLLYEDRWSVWAPVNDDESCPVMDFMEGIDGNHQGAVDKMISLLQHVAQSGPRELPDSLSHQVGDGLWQFTKGRLRLIWFYDDGRVVVCAHAHFKKTPKIPRRDLDAAGRVRGQYLIAKTKGELVYERDG